MALNTPMKIVLTLVIIFLIGIGFYLLDYQKKFTEITFNERQLAEKKDQLETNKKRVQDLPLLLEKRDKLQNQLDTLIQNQLPKEEAAIFVPKFIQSMEELVASEKIVTGDTTVQLMSITPGRLEMPGAKDEKTNEPSALLIFPKQPFQVNMRARYSTVIHLLHQLAALKLQRLITIQRIALSPAEAPTYGVSPALSVNMPMIAYLNEGKSEEEKTDDKKAPPTKN